MRRLARTTLIALVIASTTVTTGVYGQTAPPTDAPTLWSFLGIPQAGRKIKGALTNRRGNLPRLEPKLPMKALNDPANLESPVSAIKEAAKVKIQEDLKPQKIKAIKYLTKIGCGCYDLEGNITKALLESSTDCTEDVRLATVEAIEGAAEGGACNHCGERSCCNEKIVKRLAEIAYDRKDDGCWVEPSERVREAAKKALRTCCPNELSDFAIEMEAPDEPTRDVPERDRYEDIPDAEPLAPTVADPDDMTSLPSAVRQAIDDPEMAPVPQSPAPIRTRWRNEVPADGTIAALNEFRGIAHVHLHRSEVLAPGTVLSLYRAVGTEHEWLGDVEVYEGFAGSANVRAVGNTNFSQAIVGDVVVQATIDQGIFAQSASVPASTARTTVGHSEARRQSVGKKPSGTVRSISHSARRPLFPWAR